MRGGGEGDGKPGSNEGETREKKRTEAGHQRGGGGGREPGGMAEISQPWHNISQ